MRAKGRGPDPLFGFLLGFMLELGTGGAVGGGCGTSVVGTGEPLRLGSQQCPNPGTPAAGMGWTDPE